MHLCRWLKVHRSTVAQEGSQGSDLSPTTWEGDAIAILLTHFTYGPFFTASPPASLRYMPPRVTISLCCLMMMIKVVALAHFPEILPVVTK